MAHCSSAERIYIYETNTQREYAMSLLFIDSMEHFIEILHTASDITVFIMLFFKAGTSLITLWVRL